MLIVPTDLGDAQVVALFTLGGSPTCVVQVRGEYAAVYRASGDLIDDRTHKLIETAAEVARIAAAPWGDPDDEETVHADAQCDCDGSCLRCRCGG